MKTSNENSHAPEAQINAASNYLIQTVSPQLLANDSAEIRVTLNSFVPKLNAPTHGAAVRLI